MLKLRMYAAYMKRGFYRFSSLLYRCGSDFFSFNCVLLPDYSFTSLPVPSGGGSPAVLFSGMKLPPAREFADFSLCTHAQRGSNSQLFQCVVRFLVAFEGELSFVTTVTLGDYAKLSLSGNY
jgi:hypothetical protein